MKHLTLLVTIVMAFCAASPSPLLAHGARQDKPVDVAGKWALTVETTGGTGTPTMKGKVTVGDVGEGTFTGKKQ